MYTTNLLIEGTSLDYFVETSCDILSAINYNVILYAVILLHT